MPYLMHGGTLEGVTLDDDKAFQHQINNDSGLSYLSSSVSSSLASYQEDSFKITLRRLGIDEEQFSQNLLELLHGNNNRHWQELDASRNQMSTIPPTIQRFTSLTHLNLSCNHISIIPEAICQLTQLQYLVLSENQITAIPNDLPHFLPHLLVLCLDDNQLTELPDTIGQWQHLRELRLGSEFGGNLIQQLPSSLPSMHSLVELDFSFNRIRALSSFTFQHMDKLRYLNLSHNQLTELPQDDYTFQSCRQLCTLDLSDNFITELTLINARDLTGLMEHGVLELLNLSDNRLRTIPTEILDQIHTQVVIMGNPLVEYHRQESHARDSIQLSIQRSLPVSEFENAIINHQSDTDEQHTNILNEEEDAPSNITEENTILEDVNNSSRHLLHSLREIAIRAAVLHNGYNALTHLPQHIANEIKTALQLCPQCEKPFAHEWVSTTQLKTYRGHPSVVRDVRFCSTQCWQEYREMLHQQALASQSNVTYPTRQQQHALEYITQHPQVRDSNSFDWVMAAAIASAEQERQNDLLANLPSS